MYVVVHYVEAEGEESRFSHLPIGIAESVKGVNNIVNKHLQKMFEMHVIDSPVAEDLFSEGHIYGNREYSSCSNEDFELHRGYYVEIFDVEP